MAPATPAQLALLLLKTSVTVCLFVSVSGCPSLSLTETRAHTRTHVPTRAGAAGRKPAGGGGGRRPCPRSRALRTLPGRGRRPAGGRRGAATWSGPGEGPAAAGSRGAAGAQPRAAAKPDPSPRRAAAGGSALRLRRPGTGLGGLGAAAATTKAGGDARVAGRDRGAGAPSRPLGPQLQAQSLCGPLRRGRGWRGGLPPRGTSREAVRRAGRGRFAGKRIVSSLGVMTGFPSSPPAFPSGVSFVALTSWEGGWGLAGVSSSSGR